MPDADEYVPEEQLVQKTEALLAENLPAGQVAHAPWPAVAP